MKKSILIAFFVFISISYLLAQNVKGVVVDGENKQPLGFVTIKIVDSDSTLINGVISDDKGRFSTKVSQQSFGLQISYIGYKEIYLFVKNVDNKGVELGEIAMFRDTVSIGEVVVTASNIKEEIDRLVVFPSLQQKKSSASGLDLLQNLQLPGLFVDPILQKVEIRGTSGVVYRINGLNSTMEQVLALKADQIQRVEYQQTASIRELDKDAGVLNIILKQATTGTYLFTNTQGAFTTGFINSNTSIKTVFFRSEIALDYNMNWRDYSKRWSTEEEAFYSDRDTIAYFKSGRYAPFGYLSQNINLSYTFNDTKNIFSVKFLNTLFNSHDRNLTDIYSQYSGNRLFFREIHATNSTYIPAIDVYYIRKFNDREGIETNLVGTLIDSEYERTLEDEYANHTQQVYNLTDGNRKSLILESFYYNRRNKINFNIGVRGLYSYTKNEYHDAQKSQIEQVNIYPYASINGKIKNLSYTLGTGVRIVHTDDRDISKTYYRNLSTFSLFYSQNNVWNIRNVFQYTPSYPSLSILNDIEQVQDSLMIIRGNPTVKPSQTISDVLTFTYSIKPTLRTVVTLRGSKTFDPVRSSFFYDQVVGSFINQPFNQNYDRILGSSAEVQWSSLMKIFHLSAGVLWNNYKSKGIDYTHTLNNVYWYASANANLKDFTLSGGYQKTAKTLSGQVVSTRENYSSVAVTYKKKSVTLTAGMLYPFTKGTEYATERLASNVPSNKKIYIKDNANMFYLRFAYSISWGKSLFNINKSLRNADGDSGIVRVNDN